jgi:hypothetical protein
MAMLLLKRAAAHHRKPIRSYTPGPSTRFAPTLAGQRAGTMQSGHESRCSSGGFRDHASRPVLSLPSIEKRLKGEPYRRVRVYW